jgi:hypothetical protein
MFVRQAVEVNVHDSRNQKGVHAEMAEISVPNRIVRITLNMRALDT